MKFSIRDLLLVVCGIAVVALSLRLSVVIHAQNAELQKLQHIVSSLLEYDHHLLRRLNDDVADLQDSVSEANLCIQQLQGIAGDLSRRMPTQETSP